MSDRRASVGGGGGGGALVGAIGGDETAGAAAGREATGAGLETGSGMLAAGFGTRVSPSCPLRLPNTTILHDAAHLPRSFSIRGDSSEPRGFLLSLRPVSRCAICRNISVVRWLADTSAIIWPLLAAEPNICGSKGIVTIGWILIAFANSPALVSGRFRTPTLVRQ